jgi:hypothetical protein
MQKGLTVEVVDAENHCERDEDRHVQLADDTPFDGGINLERRDLDVCVAGQALLVGGAHRLRGSVSLLLGRGRRMEQRRTEEAKKRRAWCGWVRASADKSSEAGPPKAASTHAVGHRKKTRRTRDGGQRWPRRAAGRDDGAIET